MNERILKLATPYFPRDTDGWISASDEDIVKFAELIVRECAGLCGDPVVVLQHWGLDSE